jgi:hypothetical protein
MILSGQVILIVDSGSGPFVAKLQEALSSAGAETVAAGDAMQAIILLRTFDFTTVLLGLLPNNSTLLAEIGGVPLATFATTSKVATVVLSLGPQRSAG